MVDCFLICGWLFFLKYIQYYPLRVTHNTKQRKNVTAYRCHRNVTVFCLCCLCSRSCMPVNYWTSLRLTSTWKRRSTLVFHSRMTRKFVLSFLLACAIQVLPNPFFWKFDTHPPPRNANNVKPYTFVMLFSRKSDTPAPIALRNTWMLVPWPTGM